MRSACLLAHPSLPLSRNFSPSLRPHRRAPCIRVRVRDSTVIVFAIAPKISQGLVANKIIVFLMHVSSWALHPMVVCKKNVDHEHHICRQHSDCHAAKPCIAASSKPGFSLTQDRSNFPDAVSPALHLRVGRCFSFVCFCQFANEAGIL